ncbi:recombinase family protein [Ahrensia kielensis]|uniref:recombinase family protein n=1 Tax=Ahrensia kielensis TaxID=76980 RepID=UPI0003A08284|nr:recombinase family protein [Ahrensia kielensis]
MVHYDTTGKPHPGDRTINLTEAHIVERIFKDYAEGLSPKNIAEGIAGPTGRNWCASTIHGNRERGTGTLTNELYIGRQIWNRLNYAKAPDKGKRVSPLNPEEDLVITDIPDLRIIDQDLWEAVRTRQGMMKVKNINTPS